MLLNNAGKNIAYLNSARGTHLFLEDPQDQEKEIEVVDMISGMWHVGLGHDGVPSRENLVLPTIKYAHDRRDELVETLCELFGYSGVILGLNGSDATDAALRIAMALSKRSKILALEEGYHGCTVFAALAGRDLNRIGIPESLRKETDGGTIGRWAFAETIDEEVMSKELEKISWSELAAFIFEPVQGSAGGWKLNALAYEAIAQKCKQHGVFIIADEVMTGIGRCGYLAFSETYTTKPDMLALGKMLGNGMPVSALLASETITKQHTRLHRTGYYAATNAGNHEACYRAIEVLERVSRPHFLQRVRANAEILGSEFLSTRFLPGCSGVKAARATGLFFCLAISSMELAEQVHQALLYEEHFSVDLSGQKLRFCPPLTMEVEVVSAAFAATQRQLQRFTGDSK